MKKFLSFLIAVNLCLLGNVFAYIPQYTVSYGTPQSLGYSLTAAYIERSVVTYEDGKPVSCISVSGSDGALIQVVDVIDGEILHTFKQDFSGYFYFGAVNYKNYNVYMGIGKHLVEYDPSTKTATDLGTVTTTNSGSITWVATDDETGDVFGTASPYSYIWKYDFSEKKLSTFTSTLNGSAGLGGLAVSGDYVYVYAQDASGVGKLAKIHKENATDISYIDLPQDLGAVSSVGQIYSGGGRIIAQIASEQGTYMRIYTIDTGVWETAKFQMGTTSMTDMFENKFYYAYSNYLHSFDVTTLETAEYKNVKTGSHLRGNGMFFKYDGMDGYCFVNSQYNGNLYVVNPSLQKTIQVPAELVGAPLSHRISRLGVDGRVYVGAFKGSNGAAVNPETGEKEYYAADQTEGLTGYGTKMYLGGYAEGIIYELDTEKAYCNDYKTNPIKLCTIGENQNRPFDLEVLNNGKTLAVASQCVSGEYGGALTIIDLDTKDKKVYRNIVENQNLVTVTSKGSTVYAGSTITSGGGLAPIADKAKVIAFDTKTNKVTAETEINIPGCEKSIPIIKGLLVGKDGDLYGYTPGAYFVLDSDTLELKRYNLFDESQIETDRSFSLQLWHEMFMQFDPTSGYLVVDGNFINPDTLQVVTVKPDELQNMMFAGISDDGEAYFTDSSTTVYKVKIEYDEIQRNIYTESFNGVLNGAFSNVWTRNDSKVLPLSYKNGAARICVGIGKNRGTGIYKDKNVLSCEIMKSYFDNQFNGKLIIGADITAEKDNLCVVFAPRTNNSGDLSGLYFGIDGTNVIAQDEVVGKIAAGEWHNFTMKYDFGSEIWSAEYYFDGKKVGEAAVECAVACSTISLILNAHTSNEEYAANIRYDGRGEFCGIDNLAISTDEDIYNAYSGGRFGQFNMTTAFSDKTAVSYVEAGYFENAHGSIYAAKYSGDKLISVEKTPMEIKKYNSDYFTSFTEDCDEIKVFAWDDKFVPMCEPNTK